MLVSADAGLAAVLPSETGFTANKMDLSNEAKILQITSSHDNTAMVILREHEMPCLFSIWSIPKVVHLQKIKVRNVTAVKFNKTTVKHIGLGTSEGDVIFYDPAASTIDRVYENSFTEIKILDFSSDDRKLIGLDHTGIFSVTSDGFIKRYHQALKCCTIQAHPFIGNHAALGYENGSVAMLNLDEGTKVFKCLMFDTPVTLIALSPCGQYVAGCSDRLKVCGINHETKNTSLEIEICHNDVISAIAWCPNDNFIAVGFQDGTLRVHHRKELFGVYTEKLFPAAVSNIIFLKPFTEIGELGPVCAPVRKFVPLPRNPERPAKFLFKPRSWFQSADQGPEEEAKSLEEAVNAGVRKFLKEKFH